MKKNNTDKDILQGFNWKVRVYYEDTDADGVVYYSNYLKYMERARTEWLRDIGILQSELRSDQGLIFAVTKVNIHFQLPARIDDMLNINTKLIKAGGARLTFSQSITNQDSTALCNADVIVACLQADSGKPKRLPDSIRVELINDN